MYYHIYVEFFAGNSKNPKKESCYEKDMETLDRIKKYYVKPFEEGKQFFISGRVIRPDTINVFRILESDKSLDQLLNEKNNGIPNGVIMWYTSENLLAGHFEGINDITNEVMNGEK